MCRERYSRRRSPQQPGEFTDNVRTLLSLDDVFFLVALSRQPHRHHTDSSMQSEYPRRGIARYIIAKKDIFPCITASL
jgi:hypothetical protein